MNRPTPDEIQMAHAIVMEFIESPTFQTLEPSQQDVIRAMGAIFCYVSGHCESGLSVRSTIAGLAATLQLQQRGGPGRGPIEGPRSKQGFNDDGHFAPFGTVGFWN